MFLSKKLIAIVLLAYFCPSGAAPLFDDSTALEVTVAGPLSSLLEEDDDQKELRFVLQANELSHSIKVRLRGNSRRRVCDFPPLRLNFTDDDTAQSVFEGQDKLKLVTHCRNSNSSELNMLEEYAAYRIFNLISDVSYKVRLLRITYTDTDGRLRENNFDRYGFLIETASALAGRVGGEPVQVPAVSLPSLDSQQAASVYIFQYLIGNTDWSLVTADTDDTCCHNGDLFDIASDLFYVPYDFDLSGLVNASYARPDPSLRISRVTKRRYRGYCIATDALRSALSTIKARRAEILDVISELPVLSQKDIERKTKYLDQFFEQTENEDKIVKSFDRRCL
ncbi:MAG: hypothetical protein HKN43_14290 [Rhodothermales bacterium]|nr:hypothetical protein [Rhodothermales bacterium]